MKRALVLSLAVILGLGIGAFGQITGYWSTTLGIDPQPLSFVSMASTLKVDYALSGWTFGSVSTFSITGFSAQAFKVAGSLGAFTLVTNMAFAPAVVSEKTYPDLPSGYVLYFDAENLGICPWIGIATEWAPAFLTWDVTAGVSIAGVSIEAYVLQDVSASGEVALVNYLIHELTSTTYEQTNSVTCASTADKGMGWRLLIGGSFGAVDITSYTYFNLTELTMADYNDAYGIAMFCPLIGMSGEYTVGDGCGFPFTGEYLLVEGFAFGCATIDAALWIDCDGFQYAKFLVSDIALGNWGAFSFAITFTTETKTVDTCIVLTPLAGPCFTVEIGGFQGTTLDTLELYGFSFTSMFGGVKFTSVTELNIASELMSDVDAWTYLSGPSQFGFLVPFVGVYDCVAAAADVLETTPTGAGKYLIKDDMWTVKCMAETQWRLWEKFVIDVDADACCGGLFDLTVSTFFGDEEVLDYYGYFEVHATDTTYDATGTSLLGTIPTSAVLLEAGDLAALKTKPYDRIVVVSDYKDGEQTSLFNWAKTTVALGVGLGSNVSLTAGFDLSVYGWDKITFGFKWSF